MSIETVLTLGVAGAILAIALVMRLLTFAAVRLVKLAMGKSGAKVRRPARPSARHAAPRKPWGDVLTGVAQGAGTLGLALIAWVVAGVGGVLGRILFAAEMAYDGALAVGTWIAPQITGAYGWARPRAHAATRAVAAQSWSNYDKARAWWQRRMVPSLHRLATEEVGAVWPAGRLDRPESGHRVIRLDDADDRREELVS
jgi:hypothetical protein